MSEILKKQLEFKKGEVLFQDDGNEDIFYFVISGHVGIFFDYAQSKIPLAIVGKLQAVGDLSAIDKTGRSATAVALTDVLVIPIQRSKVDEQLALCPPWFCTIVKLVVERLRAANEI